MYFSNPQICRSVLLAVRSLLFLVSCFSLSSRLVLFVSNISITRTFTHTRAVCQNCTQNHDYVLKKKNSLYIDSMFEPSFLTYCVINARQHTKNDFLAGCCLFFSFLSLVSIAMSFFYYIPLYRRCLCPYYLIPRIVVLQFELNW